MISRRTSSAVRRPRAGYTLLELLISVVLLATLMTAVQGLLSMYNSLLTAGKEQTREQQLVRSVFRILSDDLGAIALQTADSPDLPDGDVDVFLLPNVGMDETLSNVAADQFTESSLMTDTVNGPPTVSLTGTSAALRLTIHRPDPPAVTELSAIDLLNALGGGSVAGGVDSLDGRAPRVPELRTIVYQSESFGRLPSPGSLPTGLYRLQVDAATLMARQSQRSTIEQSLSSGEDVSVSRQTLEALLFPQDAGLEAESSFETPAEDIPTVERIPEVVSCRFEYLDGNIWVRNWPDDRATELPAAIRISLDVASLSAVQAREQLTAGPDSNVESPLDRRLRPPFARRTATAPAGSQNDATAMLRVDANTYSRIILLDSTRAVPSSQAGFPGGAL